MAAEKELENKVKRMLKAEGIWYLKTWSNGVQRSGVPDILACCNGQFMGIELKASNGRPSDLQIYNLQQIDKNGGYAVLLYPDDWTLFECFIKAVNIGADETARRFYRQLVAKRDYWKGVDKI